MVLKTGKNCEWEDIKVGEVFAFRGCWTVAYKEDEDRARVLTCDGVGLSFYPEEQQELINNELFKIGKIDKGSYWDKDQFKMGSEYMVTLGFSDYERPFFKLPITTQRLWKSE